MYDGSIVASKNNVKKKKQFNTEKYIWEQANPHVPACKRGASTVLKHKFFILCEEQHISAVLISSEELSHLNEANIHLSV